MRHVISKHRRLCIIPARGGSKRIPDKNIRNFCGEPILNYSLKLARDSGLFSTIHVSTECEKVQKVAAFYGFRPDFLRSAELAQDHTPIMPVLHYTVEEYARRGQFFSEIWMITPCAPLIKVPDLQAASDLFDKFGATTPVLAVGEYPAPIEWAYRRSTSGQMLSMNPQALSVRSQDLDKAYFDSGTFAIFPSAVLTDKADLGLGIEFLGYVLPKHSAVDIDDEDDWNFAEALYRMQQLN